MQYCVKNSNLQQNHKDNKKLENGEPDDLHFIW